MALEYQVGILLECTRSVLEKDRWMGIESDKERQAESTCSEAEEVITHVHWAEAPR